MNIIVATTKNNGIGYSGGIPWHNKSDLQHFKNCTKDGIVIMGRKTWESLPIKPLPKRLNIVLSRNKEFRLDLPVIVVDSLMSAFNVCSGSGNDKKIWIIGGEKLYRESMLYVSFIYKSVIPGDYTCDTFFPDIPDCFKLTSQKDIGKGVVVQIFKNDKQPTSE